MAEERILTMREIRELAKQGRFTKEQTEQVRKSIGVICGTEPGEGL